MFKIFCCLIVEFLLPLRLFVLLQSCSRTCKCSAQSHHPVTKRYKIVKKRDWLFRIWPCQIGGCCKLSSTLDAPPSNEEDNELIDMLKTPKDKRNSRVLQSREWFFAFVKLPWIPTSGVNWMLLLNFPSAGSKVWNESSSTTKCFSVWPHFPICLKYLCRVCYLVDELTTTLINTCTGVNSLWIWPSPMSCQDIETSVSERVSGSLEWSIVIQFHYYLHHHHHCRWKKARIPFLILFTRPESADQVLLASCVMNWL